MAFMYKTLRTLFAMLVRPLCDDRGIGAKRYWLARIGGTHLVRQRLDRSRCASLRLRSDKSYGKLVKEGEAGESSSRRATNSSKD